MSHDLGIGVQVKFKGKFGVVAAVDTSGYDYVAKVLFFNGDDAYIMSIPARELEKNDVYYWYFAEMAKLLREQELRNL